MTKSVRTLALLVVGALALAACGQKDGVHVGLQSAAAPAEDDFGTEDFTDDEFVDDFTDDDFGMDDFGDDDPAFDPDTGTDPATADPGTTQPRQPQQQPAQQQPAQQQPAQQQPAQQQPTEEQPTEEQPGTTDPADRTGITDTQIKIGVHAPLSGAAPLPQQEFQSGRDQYWRHVGKVENRDVEVIVKDDTYNPSRATSVCNELIQREKVFILVGGGGADQIAACARTAAQQGVPYLSAGVDEGPLRQLRNYFALSMSYVQQARLLAAFIDARHKPSDGRVALVRDRTPSFTRAVDTLAQELTQRGMQPTTIQFQNAPSTAQAVAGYDTAFAIMAPSDFVQIVGAPGGSNPQWVGVGITMGLNTVANSACTASGGRYRGEFFSPFPGLNQIGNLDPEFAAAGGRGDIELALWGLNKTIHEVFKKMGDNLGRSNLMRALETNVIETNVYPTLRHSRDNHFGANQVHLLVANCSSGVYETPPDGLFKSSF